VVGGKVFAGAVLSPNTFVEEVLPEELVTRYRSQQDSVEEAGRYLHLHVENQPHGGAQRAVPAGRHRRLVSVVAADPDSACSESAPSDVILSVTNIGTTVTLIRLVEYAGAPSQLSGQPLGQPLLA
jgi:hypothetical protein